MNRLIRRTVTTALLLAVPVVWVLLMNVSSDGFYVEQTGEGIARAVAVVPRGILLSLLLLVAVAGLAWWTRWRPFLALGYPEHPMSVRSILQQTGDGARRGFPDKPM